MLRVIASPHLNVCKRSFLHVARASSSLAKTALHDFHVRNGGKMVAFAGYDMPVQYADQGVLASHLHTRQNASIFDVGHMMQTRIDGKDRVAFIESLTVADVQGLANGQSTLSLFVNPQGGIMDDTIIQVQPDHLYVVSNAGTREKIWPYLQSKVKEWKQSHPGSDLSIKQLDRSLIALQGPHATTALEALLDGPKKPLNQVPFMEGSEMRIKGLRLPVHVTRCGYTGEDGFEIACDHSQIEQLCELLLKDPKVKMAGLGPRDSLRLEAGLCLYGHDIDETITPVEGTLVWTIGKRRREPNANAFLGRDIILNKIKQGVEKKRVGLIVEGAPAREGYEIFASDKDEKIGVITSGGPSPSTKQNIAMGYVATPFAKNGTPVRVKVRGKLQPAKIAKMPFVEAKYHKI